MDPVSFEQLLDLERNLSQAQTHLSSSSSTGLLVSFLENQSSGHISSSSSVSRLDVEDLLQRKGTFNLALTCSACHQSIFHNDEMATQNTPRIDLESCCLKTINQSYSDVEISFWWFLLNSPSSCTLTFPNYTRFVLSTGGIPPQLRDRVWGILTQSCDSQGVVDDYMDTLYKSLNNDHSPDLRIILKDVNRTFPELSMFNEYDTKVKFERILNAYSIFDSDMGYCQGLQFIVAPFLFHYNNTVKDDLDELKTFNSIVKFFEMNKLRNIYDNQMTDLNLWFYQFERIFESQLPELYQHFQDLDVDCKVFLPQWFLSFYSITIPFSFLIRMFDIMLFEGVQPTLLRVGLVILSHNQSLLLNIDDAELIYQHLLSENCWGVFSNDVDEFVNSIMQLCIENFTTESLSLLRKNYLEEGKSKEVLNNESVFEKVFNILSMNLKSSTESVFSSSSNSLENDSNKSTSIFSKAFNSSNTSLSTSSSDRTSKESNTDLDLLNSLYKLCIQSNIDDPLLEQVKQRLDLVGSS